MVFGLNLGLSSKKNSSKAEYDKSGTRMPITPGYWDAGVEELNTNIGDFANAYGYGNVNPEQQGAMNTLSGINQANYASDFLKKNVNPAIQAQAWGAASMIPDMNYSVAGTTPQVDTQTGYAMAEPYRAAYGTDVLDTSLADYDTGVARAGNSFRAANIGGGGQAMGSQPVAAGVLAGEAARGRGSLAAGIRSDILDKSFGFGAQDASRKQSGDMFNADMSQQDRMANLQASIQGDAQKLNAYNQVAQLIQQQGDNALKANSAESQNAINALQAAGIPVEQAIALIQAQIAGYNAAVPGFGEQYDESGTETQSGKSSGFSFGFSGSQK